MGPSEANPKEVLCFFDKILTQIWDWGPGRAWGRAGPGRQKRARYFENIKVQDRKDGRFAARIIGFGAIWTQLVANPFLVNLQI